MGLELSPDPLRALRGLDQHLELVAVAVEPLGFDLPGGRIGDAPPVCFPSFDEDEQVDIARRIATCDAPEELVFG